MKRSKIVMGICAVAVVLAVAAAPGAALAGDGSTVTTADNAPKPLTVTIDGDKRLKVAKKLRFQYSCSIACTARVRSLLVMPGGTFKNEGTQPILGGQVWERVLTLSSSTRNYLRAHYKKSKLKVKVTADSPDTGERVSATRVFRFRR